MARPPREKGTIHKDPGSGLNVALVYPNTYRVGMSNLGVHTIYRLLNAHPGICCERFFLDQERSVESGRRLKDFHLVAFSISFEMDWINVARILAANKIPLRSEDRGGVPVVMAGGTAVTLNPEPLADALDFCFLGDGEEMAPVLFDAFDEAADYDDLLDRLSGQPGIYIPARTLPVYEQGRLSGFSGPEVRQATVAPLTDPARSVIFSPDTLFGDMYLLEIARGCNFSCKFCTAREVYYPCRALKVEDLAPCLDEAAASGLKLGLVSASLNSHPEAPRLYEEIARRNLRIAPPSLRVGLMSDALVDLMKSSGVKGITIAPEAGSDRLRRSIGKVITDEMILADVQTIIASGVQDIKLYFLVGLPGEEPEDIEAIIDLVKRVRQLFVKVSRGNRRIGRVSVSINTMIPKPRTPFEREPMVDPGEAKRRIKHIARALKSEDNVHVTFEGPKWAYLQTLLARGDRTLLPFIEAVARYGDGTWQEQLRSWERNPDYYTLRPVEKDEILPWHFARRGKTNGRG